MKIQFNAFIPGFLGLPLTSAVAFSNKERLVNDEQFYRELRGCDMASGNRSWIAEPLSETQFAGTDNRNFGGHNIYKEKDNENSRLYLYPIASLKNGLELKSIGKMKQKYPGKIFEKKCGKCHRVTVMYGYDYDGIYTLRTSSPSDRYKINPQVSCHYGHYRSNRYRKAYYECQGQDPEDNSFTVPDIVFDISKDHSRILASAQAGYVFGEPFAPNIDIDLAINMYRLENEYKIEILGTHNRFPYYEMLINGEIVYKYTPAATGPSLLNLNLPYRFSYKTSFYRE